MTDTTFKKPDDNPIRLFLYLTRSFLVAVICLLAISPGRATDPHPIVPEYCNLLVTYACHAKSLWHDKPEGGYWGDGFDAKNQNGAVRGNCNTLLTYAILVRGLDSGWINSKDIKKLKRADLDRDQLVDYIRKNIAYVTSHHKSSGLPVQPQWGYHWQSSLWMQSLGPAALLTWTELSDDMKLNLARVAAAEADRIASRPPRGQVPGNTAAEENAWDTAAPAVALAISPNATSSTLWWNALKSYAANTLSHLSDRQSSASIGTDRVSEIVSTDNVSSDWTLINHGFFHPDYVQVSGQHLGEAWLILAMGDAIHGGNLASQFEPYSQHNVRTMWELIMRPLLLPTGEFAFPAGNDWTYHCTTNQAYFAFIATALDSYDAAEAEARAINHVQARREASPPGRLLGDSNLEWWWEPLVCKRMSMALLHHIQRPKLPARLPAAETVDNLTTSVHLTDSRIWWHRTPDYFFSVSYAKPLMSYFVPLRKDMESMAYTTLPGKGLFGFKEPRQFKPLANDHRADYTGGTFWENGRAVAAVVCLPHSVVTLSRTGFHPMYVENDTLTDPGRTVISNAGSKLFPTLKKVKDVAFASPWINIDNQFGLISGEGFTWKPAAQWTQKSVAADTVTPRAEAGAWQMLAADETVTKAVSDTFAADTTSTGVIAVVQDGKAGQRYRARLTDDGLNLERLQ